jgi:phenylpropionate dioxygenase-like ring-hydroxylating dioxygenase large terminal subunit
MGISEKHRDMRHLVQEDCIHRDLYIDERVFAQEQQELFVNAWTYLGHDSQIPTTGDFFTLDVAGQPFVVLRDQEGEVRAFHNRCPHRGAKLFAAESGRLDGRFIRCAYHSWSFRLNGTHISMPLKEGYEGTNMACSSAGEGMKTIGALQIYRGFIFGRVNPEGVDFQDYFGEVLSSIDLMVDRSPTGELRIEGGVLRNTINCNWKLYLENINDSVHPVSTHESAVRAAQSVAQDWNLGDAMPMAFEQILPFGQRYDFFKEMGGHVFPNGHSISGTRFSIHSGYGVMPEYVSALQAAHGEVRTKEILERSPQNTVLYPSLALKGSPQTIRVIRPIAVNRTVIESWNFRTVGGPELLLDRALTYSRLVYSPMSVVAHDDVHLFEMQQQGMRSNANEWISLHREYAASELAEPNRACSGTSELLLRNFHRAWTTFMTSGSKEA